MTVWVVKDDTEFIGECHVYSTYDKAIAGLTSRLASNSDVVGEYLDFIREYLLQPESPDSFYRWVTDKLKKEGNNIFEYNGYGFYEVELDA